MKIMEILDVIEFDRKEEAELKDFLLKVLVKKELLEEENKATKRKENQWYGWYKEKVNQLEETKRDLEVAVKINEERAKSVCGCGKCADCEAEYEA